MQNRATQILSLALGMAASGCGGKSMLDVPAGQGGAASAASTSSGGMLPGCSEHALRRFESLRALALELQRVKTELTELLAMTCGDIATELGQDSPLLMAQPTVDDVRATCAAAVAAIEGRVVPVGIGATVTEGTCGCAKDAEAYFDCLDPCESLSEGNTGCGEVCYCQAYCEAVGMVTPRCSDCSVTVDVADAVLAATLDRHLPAIYGALNRADLGFWGAEELVEAGRELGRGLGEGCSPELAPQLDAVLGATEACAPELGALRDAASSVRTAAASS